MSEDQPRQSPGTSQGGQFAPPSRTEPDLTLTPTSWITDLQRELAEDFFALPASRGFAVSGGAALIAHRVVDRRSDDLDLFTYPGAGDVRAASDALEGLARGRGWSVTRIHDNDTFVRMSIVTSDGDELLVDLALDAKPMDDSTLTFLGPTMGLEENAGRKLLALFGRAEPRDFVDVYALQGLLGRERLVELAAQRDAGFDRGVLAQMIAMLDRIPDDDLPMPGDQREPLRAFFTEWVRDLTAGDV